MEIRVNFNDSGTQQRLNVFFFFWRKLIPWTVISSVGINQDIRITGYNGNVEDECGWSGRERGWLKVGNTNTSRNTNFKFVFVSLRRRWVKATRITKTKGSTNLIYHILHYMCVCMYADMCSYMIFLYKMAQEYGLLHIIHPFVCMCIFWRVLIKLFC